MLTVWAEYAADLRVLILASRGRADPLATSTPPSSGPGWVGRAPGRVRSGGSYAVLSYGPPDDPDDDLIELLGLGGLLPDRLAATVIAAWAGRLRGATGPGEAAGADPEVATAADAAATAADAAALAAARPALHAALCGRVTVALRSWTGQRDLPVALTMIPEDQPPRLVREGDGIAAQLPFGWLSDVWARGLTTCWGRFCLAAEPAGEGWVLSTVGLDLGPPRRVTLGNPPAS